jgi:O-antigen/teichoic acid export membrane protein
MNKLFILLKRQYGTYSLSSLHIALQIVTALSNLVITPLLIDKLGLHSYALWVTVNACSGLLLLADWGFLNTFRVNMTKIYIQDKLFVKEIWKKAHLYMHCSAAVAVCLIIFTIPNSQLSLHLWHGRNLAIFEIGFLIAYLTLFEHLFLVKSQILGSELKSTALLVIFRFSEGVSQILVLVINPSIHLIFLISLVFRFGSLVFIAMSVPRNLMRSVSNNIYSTSIGGVLKESVGSGMFVLSNVIYNNVFTLILTKVLTIEFLAVVQVSRMLVSPIRIIGSSISLGTLQSQLQRKIRIQEDYPKFGRRTQLHIFYMLLVCAIFVSIFASHVWEILFPKISGFNQTLIIMFAFQYLLDSLIWLNSRDFYNRNRLVKLGLSNLLLSTFAIISIPFFYTHFDILGVPFPLIIFDIVFLSIVLSKKGKKWLFQ